MKMTQITLLTSLAVLSLSGCMGDKMTKHDAQQPVAAAAASAPAQAMPECGWPEAPHIPAPTWTCGIPPEGASQSAFASYPKSAAGAQFVRDQATASARVNLAQQLKVQVQAMTKNYLGTTGMGNEQTVDAAASTVNKTITNASLEGSRVFKTATSPNGDIYVLVAMDPAIVEKNVKEAVKTSMNNERALWQKFMAKKESEEMAAEIAKMTADTPSVGKP